MSGHITRYDQMPIPPVEAQTEWFDAGTITLGVEYRLLNDAIAAANDLSRAAGEDASDASGLDDRGVSIHVCDNRGERPVEHLRFDCFVEDPHYHYIHWGERSNEMLHIDAVADGDPLTWALARIRTRLPQMLERAGAPDLATGLDTRALDAVLPRVAEAAFRARYRHDAEAVLRAALGGPGQ